MFKMQYLVTNYQKSSSSEIIINLRFWWPEL